jgi:hypothetical protein
LTLFKRLISPFQVAPLRRKEVALLRRKVTGSVYSRFVARSADFLIRVREISEIFGCDIIICINSANPHLENCCCAAQIH